jgi:hypothetical protein
LLISKPLHQSNISKLQVVPFGSLGDLVIRFVGGFASRYASRFVIGFAIGFVHGIARRFVREFVRGAKIFADGFGSVRARLYGFNMPTSPAVEMYASQKYGSSHFGESLGFVL